MSKLLRLNLVKVEETLLTVKKNWKLIDEELDRKKIGRKDHPFDKTLMDRMMSAYSYMDHLLRKEHNIFQMQHLEEMLELNHRVHYGEDSRLRMEYHRAMQAAKDKFYNGVPVLQKWHRKHLQKKGDDPRKVASEIYVGIIGQPQLFVEGNHRTGSLIASWIDMRGGYPPFVLSPENAINYFAPSQRIKSFKPLTNWRGEKKLPKYHKVFREYWEMLIDEKYLLER